MLIHQLFCGVGGFLLVMSIGWGILPAFLCGLALSMSGYQFCFTSIVSLVESAAWCPLSFWAIYELNKCSSSRSARNSADENATTDLIDGQSKANNCTALWTALTALLVCLQVMAGHPELCIIQFALLGAFICWTSYLQWKNQTSAWLSSAAIKIRAVALGVLLAMPTVVPALEWLHLSRRSEGIDPKEALILSANWYDLLCLILPQPLGDMQQRWSEFRPLVMEGQLVPYMASAFLGPVIFTFALSALADRKWKERWIVFGLSFLALLLAMGGNTPLVPLLLTVAKTSIRFPVKLMFFVDWGLCIMAARGLYGSLAGERRGFWLTTVFWSVFACLALMLWQHVHILDPLLHYDAMSEQTQLLLRKAEPLLGISAIYASLIGLGVSMLSLFYERLKVPVSIYSKLIVGAAIFSLLSYAFAYCRLPGPANYFNAPSVVASEIAKLKAKDPPGAANRILGVYIEHFTVPSTILQKGNLEATVATYQYSRQLMRANTNIDFNQQSSFGFEGTCTGEYYYFFHNCYAQSSQCLGVDPATSNDTALARFCQCTATQYVISQVYRFGKQAEQFVSIPALDQRLFELLVENPQLNFRIYRVKNTLPRIYFSNSWQASESRDEALQYFIDAAKTGFDPQKKTLIESTDVAPLAAQASGAAGSGTLKVLLDNANELALETETKEPSYLIVADQYYPGWVAEVDGKSTPIIRANCFTRALSVFPGKHRIVFAYRPGSLYAGLAICSLALIWILSLFWSERRRLTAAASTASSGNLDL